MYLVQGVHIRILNASHLFLFLPPPCFGVCRFALARDPFSLPVMVAWALMEESLGDIGRTRQLLEIAVATQAGNPEVWNVSVCEIVADVKTMLKNKHFF